MIIFALYVSQECLVYNRDRKHSSGVIAHSIVKYKDHPSFPLAIDHQFTGMPYELTIIAHSYIVSCHTPFESLKLVNFKTAISKTTQRNHNWILSPAELMQI